MSDQRVVLVDEVRERLPHRTPGQEPRPWREGAAFHVFPDRGSLLRVPARMARDRPEVVRVVFDARIRLMNRGPGPADSAQRSLPVMV